MRQVQRAGVSLLKADGSPYARARLLKQPDLARTYRGIAEQGTDYFYRGPFAAAVGKWMAEHGGLLDGGRFCRLSAGAARAAGDDVSRADDRRFSAAVQRRRPCRARF